MYYTNKLASVMALIECDGEKSTIKSFQVHGVLFIVRFIESFF